MRRLYLTVLAVLLGGIALAADEKTRTVKFGKADADKLPAGWTADKTGKGEGSVWRSPAATTWPP